MTVESSHAGSNGSPSDRPVPPPARYGGRASDRLQAREEEYEDDEDLGRLQPIFDLIDGNRDGLVSTDELCAWTLHVGRPLSPQSMHDMMQSCGAKRDGFLDLKEFAALSRIVLLNPKEEFGPSRDRADKEEEDGGEAEAESDSDGSCMHAAFRVFDRDGDGHISPSELGAALSDLGLLAANTSMSRIQSMIRKVDTDGDGEVSFPEFEIMMNKRSQK